MLSMYLGLFLLSAGTLLFEIALSRIFAISQWYHFAFMAVALALLGGGAGDDDGIIGGVFLPAKVAIATLV